MSHSQRSATRITLSALIGFTLLAGASSSSAEDPSIMLGFRAISPNGAAGFFLRPSMNEEGGTAKVEYEVDNSCEYYIRYDKYFAMYANTGAKVEAWNSDRLNSASRTADGQTVTLGMTAGKDAQFFYRYATMPSVEMKVLRNDEGEDIGQIIKRVGDLSYHSINTGATAQTEKTGFGTFISGSVGIGLARFEDEWSSVVIPLSAEIGGQYYLPLPDSSLIARLGYYGGGAFMIGDSPCYAYWGPSFSVYFSF